MEKIFLERWLMTAVIVLLSCFAFTSCGDDDNKDEPKQDSQEMIVGKWICYNNAYGDPWDEPLVYQFDSDGSGYQWFQDEPFSDRWEFTYSLTESKLCIKTEYGTTYNLRYEISYNGKSLVLYGWDDNDMEELHFVKQ